MALLMIMFAFTGIANAYTYDGEYDPVDFFSWKGTHAGRSGDVAVFICTRGEEVVKVGMVKIGDEHIAIVMYQYERDGVTYFFRLEGDHYRQVLPEEDEKPKTRVGIETFNHSFC